MKKNRLLKLVVLVAIGVKLASCAPYHHDDYRGFYVDKDHKDHHYTKKPKRLDE